MTSKPASRSARATSFAPRSWPSRPGFATRTRTGATIRTRPLEDRPSENSRLPVLAPHVLELLRDLADGAVLLHAFHQTRHEVLVTLRRAPQLRQCRERRPSVAGPAHLRQTVELHLTGVVVHRRWGQVR